MKPGRNKCFTARIVATAPALLLVSADQVMASPLAGQLTRVTLDGMTRAESIRHWIEIAEPSNLGLLFMGIAGLLIGRWASRNKRKGPPDQ